MRSHPAKYGEGFDAPPTLERSGSEHQRAVTSFPFREGKAWLECGAFFNVKEGRDDFRKKIR